MSWYAAGFILAILAAIALAYFGFRNRRLLYMLFRFHRRQILQFGQALPDQYARVPYEPSPAVHDLSPPIASDEHLRDPLPSSPAAVPRRRPGDPVQLGDRLGGGGQGVVYALRDDPGRVVKTLTPPVLADANDLHRIMALGDYIRRELHLQPIVVSWPEHTVLDGGNVAGYIMPRIEERFFFRAGLSRRSRIRDLQFAVSKPTVIALPFNVEDQHRLALVRLIATFLNAMHAHELVFGDVSWTNFGFSISPEVELCVYDFDSTRLLGREPFTRKPAVESPDWNDPAATKWEVQTLDTDRYKFALLTFRLLVSKDFHSRLKGYTSHYPVVPGTRYDDLAVLWRRAAGPGGTRPQISEWLRALNPM